MLKKAIAHVFVMLSNTDGQFSCYTYDPFGRVISKTSEDGTVQNYTYDANSNVLTYDISKGGESKNSTAYEYNALNRLTKLTNNDNILAYSYDANGNLVHVVDYQEVNFDITINYNQANLPVRYNSDFGGKSYLYNMSYYLNGSKYQESDSINGTVKSYLYDALGQLSQESETKNNAAVYTAAYTYNPYGNRTQMSYTSGNTTEITDYTYDANNRLTSETNSIGDNIKSATRYYYDNNGNTTAEQKTVYTTGTQKSNMSLSGRSGGSTLKLYRYDEFNRLVQYNDDGAEAVYTYGVDNLRASKTVNGTKTTYAWNGQNLAEETTHGATTVYAYDMTGVISSRVDNDSVIRYIKDPHGSVIATSKGGELYGTYDYTAFGNQLESTDTTNPFRYCGEYYDEESGLIYLRNRYYNSTTGRFISEDPIRDGANWYMYCGGNPVNAWDPTGLKYIPLRARAEREGYAVDWDYGSKMANLRGTYIYYYEGDSKGSYIDDSGKLYVWDEDYYSDTMLTRTDKAYNITITMQNGIPYKNINVPLDNALATAIAEGKQATIKPQWFFSKVNHGAEWDIKRIEPWNETIGYDTYPGWGVSVYYHGYLMTPEELGNFTYGYIGAAIGYSLTTLKTFSWLAAGAPIGKEDLANELRDWDSIEKGVDYYK